MTHLVNDLDAVVTEAVDGLVRASGGTLARLDGYPDVKVVVRADWEHDRVALVSGGGSGHEPAHAGFVGRGLLTAAVCGEIFASPSVDAVLAAIVAVTGDAGCLVIVKNYTGDRLNFGLAVERARTRGLDVAMVVVDDDIALPDTPQARGLAGTLLVHKVAGAAAEAGAPLAEVADAARTVAASVRTLGVSLSPVAVPGQPTSDRIAEGSAELGLGIHGEPGAETIDVGSAWAVVETMTSRLGETVPDGPVLVLVNNLGGVAALELAVVLHDVLASPLGARAELVAGPAALMTSLSAGGFSLSALPLTDAVRTGLTAPVADHTAWQGVRAVGELTVRPLPATAPEAPAASSDDRVRALLTAVAEAVVAAESELNALDAKVGDGDTGSTFATAARRILDSLDRLPLAEPASLFAALSTVLSSAMGGSSGVLGSIFFAAAGTAVADGADVPAGFAAGVEAVQHHGGAKPGDRTMLDALVPAIDALRNGSPADAATAAQAGADATASMTSAAAGRSAYVSGEHLTDVPDPGAVAVAVIVRAAAGG
ncbi:dihydroxyacetone kinase subunit DhaK [Jatrophihabitans sp. YIM 134969]